MKEDKLSELLNSHPGLNKLIESVKSGAGRIQTEGLYGSSKAIATAEVFRQTSFTHLVIFPEKEDAAYFYNDLVNLIGEDVVFFFPSTYKRSIQYGQTDPANIVLRTEVLNHLASGNRKGIIATYPEALMEKVLSRKTLKNNTLTIAEGNKLSIDFLEDVFQEYHFERVDFVSEPGQYSIRGSIVDIFSYSTDLPYRIDFFGDEVDSIRTFNIEDQLSATLKKRISIIPNIQDVSIERIEDTFFDFLPPSSIIWINDGSFIRDRANDIFDQVVKKEHDDKTSDKAKMILSGNSLIECFGKFKTIEAGKRTIFNDSVSITFNTELQPVFNKNFELLAERLISNQSAGYQTFIISGSQSQIDRLNDIFSEINPAVSFIPKILNLHAGFTDNDIKVSIFTDHQIFDRYHKFKIRGLFTKKESLCIKELTSLNPGDYVVHVDHGIGRFGGLEKIEVNGKLQEAIKLVYRDNDILYVSIHSLYKISKYKGKDNEEPRIYKLGSGAWQKLKQTTKSRIKDIAKDLIVLYAKRMATPGYSFSPDSYLQRELEASFIYEDTPDQLAASLSVKADMESDHPMDRLICGDVGFGKTEIAIRAAFKAVADSKQVAMLVPTTILALQHYKTFMSRLKDFPCNIEFLSRHKKTSEQKRIIRELSEGKIDIIIGTHKLVGKEITFKDLGLLIIDEEQHFGVAVKDKLKKLKANIDTLTLTATPIPRTLQFSLMGARDLSIISTPPPNRMPIATELHGFNDDIIKEAIEYEVSRDGQVFFVHNRVDNIFDIQTKIQNLCPNIKTAVIHGKLDSNIVENVMFGFIQGDYDVLIATTIIESGLDIPNANTIIIDEAHHYGLSELHQLRGRVGRSNKKAFCYLLAPPLNTLPYEARRRLTAIEEFTELGSGFNIAMQDLDIRGSGNLLGGEQSGFIADVGFETYQRILNEAICELRETDFKEEEADSAKETSRLSTMTAFLSPQNTKKGFIDDVQIDTDLEIMFTDEYISNISERIRLYKELNGIKTEEELQRFKDKLIDRFGPLPVQAEALLDIVKTKWLSVQLGMEKVLLKNGVLIAHFISNPDSLFYKSPVFVSLMNYINIHRNNMIMRQKGTVLSLTVKNITTVQEANSTLSQILNDME